MKKQNKKGFQKFIALFLTVLMVLSTIPMTNLAAFVSGAMSVETPMNYYGKEDEARVDMNFNKNWKFYYGTPSGTPQNPDNSEVGWKDVDLPHDFSITQEYTTSGTEIESGLLPGGTGWYRKTFTLPTALKGKRIIINFDGAYKETTLYVNGNEIGWNRYGYNPFSFDITNYVKFADDNSQNVNVIAVKVENRIPSSRWYSGSGLNRDVTLTVVNPVHVSRYGTKVTTNCETGAATTVTYFQNDSDETVSVVVKAQVVNIDGSENGSVVSTTATLNGGASTSVTLDPVATSLELWSIDNPKLYMVRTTLEVDGETVDQYDTKFGFRTVEFTTSAFNLNGTSIKLQGVCIHQDSGALGTIQTRDAIYRQVKILKEMGVNAIRTSHNISSEIYLDVCAELGVLVMEEFFDGWNTKGKNGNTYDFHEYFNSTVAANNPVINGGGGTKTWSRFALEECVKRDRNNPAIILWSLGNELNHSGDEGNTTVANNLLTWVRALDDRKITHGDNGNASSITANMDVVGGNYCASTVHGFASGKPFIGTEMASEVSSRGFYLGGTTGSNGEADINSSAHQVSSFGTSYPSWGQAASQALYESLTTNWYLGEFVWTGFDYIGEPTPWNGAAASSLSNPNSSYFGMIDTAGFAKDSYYLYRSIWSDDNVAHLVPGTWNNSKLMKVNSKVPVIIYSNAAKVELYLDDTKIGTATSTLQNSGTVNEYRTWAETSDDSRCTASMSANSNKSNSHDLYAEFGVTYTAGTLSIKAYDANNNEITETVGTKSVSSATDYSEPYIKAEVYDTKDTFTADGDSYVYVEYTALSEENGEFLNDCNKKIAVSLEGSSVDCEIAGVDNGNAATTAKFQQPTVLSGDRQTANINLFNGKALVIVRVKNSDKSGIVRLAQTTGTDANVTIEGATVKVTADTVKDEFEEICPQDLSAEIDNSTIKSGIDEEFNKIVPESDDPTVDDGKGTYNKYTPNGATDDIPTIANGVYILRVPETYADGGVIYTSVIMGCDVSVGEFTSWNPDNPSAPIQAEAIKSYGILAQGKSGVDDSDKYTLANGVLNITRDFEYYIEYSEENHGYSLYSLKNGKYVTMKSNGKVNFETTPQYMTVESLGNDLLSFKYSNLYLDAFAAQGKYVSCYPNANAEKNDKFELYKKVNDEAEPARTEKYTNLAPTQSSDITDKDYVIYSAAGTAAISNAPAADTSVSIDSSDDKLISSNLNEYSITKAGDYYHVKASDGRYLSINADGVALSDTPVRLKVSVLAGGKVAFFNEAGDYRLACNNGALSTVYMNATAATMFITLPVQESCFALYADNDELSGAEADLKAARAALYEKIETALEVMDIGYTKASYKAFLNAIADGIDVYNNVYSTLGNITAATDAIEAAKNALTESQGDETKTGVVKTDKQTIVADFGLPVTYKLTANDGEELNERFDKNVKKDTDIPSTIPTYAEASANIFETATHQETFTVPKVQQGTNKNTWSSNKEDISKCLYTYTNDGRFQSVDNPALYISPYQNDVFDVNKNAGNSNANTLSQKNNSPSDLIISILSGMNNTNHRAIGFDTTNVCFCIGGADLDNFKKDNYSGKFILHLFEKTDYYSPDYLIPGYVQVTYDRVQKGHQYLILNKDNQYAIYPSTNSNGYYHVGKISKVQETRDVPYEYLADGDYMLQNCNTTTFYLTTRYDGAGARVYLHHNEKLVWNFDKVDKTNAADKQYYVSTLVNGNRMYLDCDVTSGADNPMYISTTKHSVAVNINDNGKLSFTNADGTYALGQSQKGSGNETYATVYNFLKTSGTPSTFTPLPTFAETNYTETQGELIETTPTTYTYTLGNRYTANDGSYLPNGYYAISFTDGGSWLQSQTTTYETGKYKLVYGSNQTAGNNNPIDSTYVFYYDGSKFVNKSTNLELRLTQKDGNQPVYTGSEGGMLLICATSAKSGQWRIITERTTSQNINTSSGAINKGGSNPVGYNYAATNGNGNSWWYLYSVTETEHPGGPIYGPGTPVVTTTFTGGTFALKNGTKYVTPFDTKLGLNSDATAWAFVKNGNNFNVSVTFNDETKYLNVGTNGSISWSSNSVALKVTYDATSNTVQIGNQLTGTASADGKTSFTLVKVTATGETKEVYEGDKIFCERNYLGVVTNPNNLPNSVNAGSYTKDNTDLPFNDSDSIEHTGKYGSFKVETDGNTVYTLKTMNFNQNGINHHDTFYVVSEVVNDPNYAVSRYFVVEEINYVPATMVYFEDDFGTENGENGIKYTDSENATAEVGRWTTDTNESITPLETLEAELAGSEDRNAYGYNQEYANFSKYSNGKAHKVTVSQATNSSAPKAQFTFAGTGFDIISLTNNQSGTFTVKVYEGTNTSVKPLRSKIVNTYYGYVYEQIFWNGKSITATAEGNRALYKTDVTQQAVSMMESPDKDNYLVTSTGKVYAFNNDEGLNEAYGWVVDHSADSTLYQIPVMKITGLGYGTYTVVVEARHMNMGGSVGGTLQNGTYDLYLDAVRIYNPTGPASAGSAAGDSVAAEAYVADREAFVNSTVIKNLLVGANTVGAGASRGVVFIDGLRTVDSGNLDDYKNVGPNYELYLDGGQSVAFEIWATAVPTDIQIGAKLAGKTNKDSSSEAKLKVDYEGSSFDEEVRSAADMYYSFDEILEKNNDEESDNKITWTPVKDSGGNTYFHSGTIIISNGSDTDSGSILSLTNIKWTFAKNGVDIKYGRPVETESNDKALPVPEPSKAMLASVSEAFDAAESETESDEPVLMAMVNSDVISRLEAFANSLKANLEIDKDSLSVSDNNIKLGENTVITFTTSPDVDSIKITNENGKKFTVDSIKSVTTDVDGKEVKQWTVSVTARGTGEYIYNIKGIYEYAYASSKESVKLTVNVEKPEITEPSTEPTTEPSTEPTTEPTDEPEKTNTFLEKLQSVFNTLFDFIKKLFGLLGIKIK